MHPFPASGHEPRRNSAHRPASFRALCGLSALCALLLRVPAAFAADAAAQDLPPGVVCGEDGVCRFVGADSPAAFPPSAPEMAGGVETMEMVRSSVGAIPPGVFIAFLEGRSPATSSDPLARANARGGVLLLALALLCGGFLLNLSPCVLPLVPVNLALLGAGVKAGSRRSGAAAGMAYGAGIALSFGFLGLLAARGGAAFGAWHGSPLFHVALAALFALFAAASVDRVRIDFSRPRARIRIGRPRPAADRANNGPRATAALLARAFALGVIAALLSGACVAPVLASTLVLAANFSASGRAVLGAALPFLLGLGMALPWPLLGAGFAFLPRPGNWMLRLRGVYALVFAALAIWQLSAAWRLAAPRQSRQLPDVDVPADAAAPTSSAGIDWLDDEAAAVATARALDVPLLLDLYADWCAECPRFDRETLHDPAVVAAVDALGAVPLRIDCTDTSAPQVRRLLQALAAPGLPFCAIFRP